MLGRGLGRFLRLVGFRTKIVKDNLELALGDEKTKEELQILEKKIYDNIGTQFLEIARNFTIKKEQAIKELTVSPEFARILDKMKAEGRGMVAISAHMANWELFPFGMAIRGYPISIIAKKMSNPISQKLVEDRRTQGGFNIIYAGGTLAKMAEGLKRGQFIGFMVDQHMPGPRGIRANFFGVPAASIRGLAQLAKDTQCAIIPMCIFRNPDGTHHFHMMEELPYLRAEELPEGSEERKLREEWLNTQQYQTAIEKLVRMHLDQWLWIHRRWKADRTPLNIPTTHMDQDKALKEHLATH
jgi:Kdo2-lipid IVA lauroyltransferase/acyltransferase